VEAETHTQPIDVPVAGVTQQNQRAGGATGAETTKERLMAKVDTRKQTHTHKHHERALDGKGRHMYVYMYTHTHTHTHTQPYTLNPKP